MMEITLTCTECGSGISIAPTLDAKSCECKICGKEHNIYFTPEHFDGVLKDCPCCQRQDFYKQKDFNRKLGVTLFVTAALLSVWIFMSPYAPYAVAPFLVLYVFDFILFRKLKPIGICYKCNTIFRNVTNIQDIHDFNHEMNDRIVYSDHDFKGEHLDH
ncbi:hypothetical protein [Bacteriovorax sp. Seq25_V]|uniref:hypothetical protein n=1 Tax=Bacteriovorax sp. Seq25_V TaxID=1201288 RepID=UPI000558D39B|nr:hypothetical protein [Bacteriovorax sp. Seq25_V]